MGWTSPEQAQRHYERNKDRYLENASEHRKAARRLIVEAKSKPCADCGVEFPYFVMDLDHGVSEKDFAISRATQGGYGLARIAREIEKCEVVCANCHRFRTHERNEYRKNRAALV